MENPINILDGYIPQLENQHKHREFLRIVPSVDPVIIKITAARALANRGITAKQYGGDTTVITTTTIHDEKLEDLHWKDELEIVEKFNPDYHIPADCPTYQDGDQTPLERKENLDTYLEGMIYMHDRLEDTHILPLIKGEERSERKRVKEVLDCLGYDYAVFYVTQMMVSGMKHYRVIGKINQIANQFSNTNILVMGMQVPRYLKQVSSNVVAVSGQKWRKVADPTKHDRQDVVSNYRELEKKIIESLGEQEQPSLFRFKEVEA